MPLIIIPILFILFLLLEILYFRSKFRRVEDRIHDDNNQISSTLSILNEKMYRIESAESMLKDMYKQASDQDKLLKKRFEEKFSELEKLQALDKGVSDLSPLVKSLIERLRTFDINLIERTGKIEVKLRELSTGLDRKEEKLDAVEIAAKDMP